MTDKLREAFEKDAEPRGYPLDKDTCSCCVYKAANTEERWKDWKACAEYMSKDTNSPVSIQAEGKLLPCPFCGSAPVFVNARGAPQVYCEDCGIPSAEGPSQLGVYNQWNTRTPTEQQQGEVAVVDKIERCDICGTKDVSLEITCHNSDCSSYGNAHTIYEGWRDAPRIAKHPTSQWQDIASAPKDGTPILLSATGYDDCSVGKYWKNIGWVGIIDGNVPDGIREDYIPVYATHWMPLPAPPTTKTEEK